jgi:hypothetical protein
MNFAEQLVYWYLRLNGFFPITNFVLHHGAEHRTSDADLVAVRFPYVSEDIGGAPTDWELWERVRIARTSSRALASLSFDWFVLSLNLLYAISAVELANGLISARTEK